jgi:hypothetical protein
MKSNSAALLVVCLFLCGCATTKGFEAVMDSWIGSSVNDYIAQNSISPVQILPDGSGKIYMFDFNSTSYYTSPTYTSAQVSSYGNTAYGTATTTGGQTIPINNQCAWTFRTDSRGIIRHWSYRGNACRANNPD